MEQGSMGCRKKIAIIGAGPAGCMCGYYAAKEYDVTFFDFKSPLSTILCTGGGRCNLAYAEYDFKELAKFYPRGEKFLYSSFSRFSTADTIDFFEKIGVKTYMQDDFRIFPVSNSAKDVREKFLTALKRCAFKKEKVLRILPLTPNPSPARGEGDVINSSQLKGEGGLRSEGGFSLTTDRDSYRFDKVVIAVGGHAGFSLAKRLGHKIIEPKPALVGLCTLNNFKKIQGVCVKDVEAEVYFDYLDNLTSLPKDVMLNSFQHRKSEFLCGPESSSGRRNPSHFVTKVTDDILFTHQGLSGPLAYKISSVCARLDYNVQNPLVIKLDFLSVIARSAKHDEAIYSMPVIGKDCSEMFNHPASNGFMSSSDENICYRSKHFQSLLNSNPKKDIKNLISDFVPKSLAEFILNQAGIALDEKCCNIDGKKRDLILKLLTEFEITVTAPSKEGEVVTSGGVCLDEINPKTMESKLVEGIYFCGEVIDVDGFCGGFNLQNCWSTGFVAGSSL